MKKQHTNELLSWRRLYLARAKLKATSRTSALLSGFSMVAMVEIEIEKSLPASLLVAFSICTTLVVAVHLLALMISTCILPHLEAVSNFQTVTSIAVVNESPHDKMHCYIELAWIFSTGVGILLFLIEMSLLAWIRFQPASVAGGASSVSDAETTHPPLEPAFNSALSYAAPIASTVIIIPALIIFLIFALHFYRQLVSHKYKRTTRGLEEIESMANALDVMDDASLSHNKPTATSRIQFV